MTSEQCICPKDCKGFDWHCKACHPDTPPTSNDVVQRLETWGIDDADSEELYALLADASRELRDTRAGLAACNRVLQQERNAHETSRDDARDAARYRFLRQPGNAIVYAKDRNAWGKGASGHVRYDTAEQLDAAVDAARGAEEPTPPQIKPGDRVQNSETGAVGVAMTIGSERAQVQYDDGRIREPPLRVLLPEKAMAPHPPIGSGQTGVCPHGVWLERKCDQCSPLNGKPEHE